MTIADSMEIRDALVDAGCPEDRIHLADERYAMLTPKGVELFGKRFASFLWRAKLSYADESWDCDNFARSAAYYAAEDHARWEKVSAALAFGEVWYVGEDGGHAINWAAHVENEKVKICLYEPQVSWGNVGAAQVSMREVPLRAVSRWLFCSC